MSEALRFVPPDAKKNKQPKNERRVPVDRGEPVTKQAKKADTKPVDIFAGINTADKLAIVNQAIAEVEKELNQMEGLDAANFGNLTLMRKSVEKGITDDVRNKQKEEMRAIMIENKIAELVAKREEGKFEKPEMSDEDLDNALKDL